MKIFNSIEQLVGKTPLLETVNLAKEEKLFAKLLVKIEYFNPAGSVKDRVAKYMLLDAEEKGLITKGATIIEPTSGNTGIGLASLAVPKGYKVILTMPDTMSKERINLLKAYGAEIVLTAGDKGMQGSIEKAEEIQKTTPNSIIVGQFYNPANILAHYETTAPEIWEDTDGNVDFLVAGVGSGGTISGCGKFLKEKNANVKIIAVEPESSPLISKGVVGSHKIQGIGANFIPKNYDASVVDEVVAVSDENAYKYARKLAKKEGLLTGISSGANLYAGIQLAKKKENQGKVIVVILPDTGNRYLSTDLFL